MVDRNAMPDKDKGEKQEQDSILVLANSFYNALVTSVDITELLQRFASILREIVDVDWAAIALIDKTKQNASLSRLSPAVISGWDLGENIVLPGTPLEQMAKSKSALVQVDLTQRSEFWTDIFFLKQGISCVATLPLISKGDAFGGLIVGSRRPQAYQPREIKLLTYAASQIAMPIENAKLATQYEILMVQQKAIQELVDILSGSSDITETYPTFARRLKNLVLFDQCTIQIIKGKIVETLARYPYQKDKKDKITTCFLRDTSLEWIINNRTTNIEPDLSQERRFPVDEVHLKNGFRSVIRVPLFSQNDIFGILELSNQQPSAYGAREQKLLERLALFVAAPIENIRLRALQSEMTGFISAVNHELKTPLTSVIASSGLLEEELPKSSKAPKKKLIKGIIDSAHNIEGRLNKLVDLATLRTPTFSFQTELLDLKALLKEIMNQIIPQARSKGQVLTIEMPTPPLYVQGNRQKLEQVLITLLSNAIDFTAENKSVVFRINEQASSIIIEVHDSGTVFSRKEQSQLFEVYNLTEADRQFLPELRLALANAREIIKLHGGEIWLESKPDEGNIFAFSLPKDTNAYSG